jgi:hypothetical protein
VFSDAERVAPHIAMADGAGLREPGALPATIDGASSLRLRRRPPDKYREALDTLDLVRAEPTSTGRFRPDRAIKRRKSPFPTAC